MKLLLVLDEQGSPAIPHLGVSVLALASPSLGTLK